MTTSSFRETEDQQAENALASWQTSLPPPFSRFTLQTSLFNFWTSLIRDLKGETTTFTSATFSLDAAVFFCQNRSWVGIRTSTSSPTSRISSGDRRTPRQAPAPQRTDVAHNMEIRQVTRPKFSLQRLTFRITPSARIPGPVRLEPLLGSYLSPSGSVWIWSLHVNRVAVAYRSIRDNPQLLILSQFCACCSPVRI